MAEEVVQETWLAVISGIERFEGRSALGTWIFSVLANQAKTHHARERRASRCPPSARRPTSRCRRRPFPGGRRCVAGALGNAASAVAEARAAAVVARGAGPPAIGPRRAPRAAAPGRRAARRGGRVSPAEVCDLLALSPENQRVLLHRGRSRLRAVLEATSTRRYAVAADQADTDRREQLRPPHVASSGSGPDRGADEITCTAVRASSSPTTSRARWTASR